MTFSFFGKYTLNRKGCTDKEIKTLVSCIVGKGLIFEKGMEEILLVGEILKLELDKESMKKERRFGGSSRLHVFPSYVGREICAIRVIRQICVLF